MKAIEMIIQDGTRVDRFVRPAKSVQIAKKQFSGNGELLKIKEIDLPISLDKVEKALERANFGTDEIEIIRALIQYEYNQWY